MKGVFGMLALLVLSATLAAGERTLSAVTDTQQISIPYNSQYLDPMAPLPLSDPIFARVGGGLDPEQIHITYNTPSSVTISWATGEGLQYASPVQSYQDSDGIMTEVYYGTQSGQYTLNATGFTTTYTQLYTKLNGTWPLVNYTSPLLHHTNLTGLMPATKYYYTCGDPAVGMSTEYAFTTSPSAASPYPMRLGIIADLGETANSTQTVQHLIDDKPQFVTLIGDLTYADDISTNGTTTTSNGSVTSFPTPAPSGTYQPRWDAWYRWMQPLLATTPFLPQHGNHELEPQGAAKYASGLAANATYPSGSQFQSYIHRNPVPFSQSGSDNPLWYSTNLGPAHMVYLSNYADFSVGSPQYDWLVSDLASYDRSSHPWLIATWHAPWYSSYTTHYMENECMRGAMEEVLYEAGVDMVLNGHLHTYERSYPVFVVLQNFTRDSCGPVHLVIGDGGNIEGLYKTFVQQGTSTCPTPGVIPAYQPGGYCPPESFPYNGNFCPTGQPAWSAFRQPAFGHATLDFLNGTHAYYRFNRNIDAESVIADSFYLVRDTTCSNKAYEAALAPTPADSKPMSGTTATSAAGK